MNDAGTPLITSAKNPLIQMLRRLSTQAKYRREQSMTLLDGVHVCESYLNAGHEPAQVIVGQSALGGNEEVKRLVARTTAKPVVISDGLMDTISPVDHGANVLFVIDIPLEASPFPIDGDALLLDDVQDPGNMGTLLRTAAAAGITRVYTSPHSASVWAPKVLRAGMGAQFGLTIYEMSDLAQLVSAASVPVLATSLQATQTLYETGLTQPTAWLFGSEGRGVSPELLAMTNQTIIIPQASSVESLNVAAAVAVCLFEQRRQRMVH